MFISYNFTFNPSKSTTTMFVLNNYKNKQWLILGLTLILYCSCQSKEVDYIQPQTDLNRLVVFCFFNPDSIWSVHVTKLANVMDAEKKDVVLKNAIVELYENNQLLELLEYDEYRDCYLSTEERKPEYNKYYHLAVNCEGYTSVSTTHEKLPEPISIKEIIYYEELERNEFTLEIYSHSEYFFMLDIIMKVQKNQLLDATWAYSLSNSSKKVFDDYLTDGRLLEASQSGQLLLRVAVGNGRSEFRLRTISPTYFLYNMSYIEYDSVTFTTYLLTPSNIYSNIYNGCGLFTGYTESSIKISDYSY